MRCEVCGRKIHNDPVAAIIEGARLTVCNDCSKHGKIVIEEETIPLPQGKATIQKRAVPVHFVPKKMPVAKVEISQEIVEGFDVLIRHAREKLGLSHEELGKKINEKASVLRNIETGKMTPDNTLAAKLEHNLKIKLLVPVSEEKIPETIPNESSKSLGRELTLGDLIKIDKKGGEEAT